MAIALRSHTVDEGYGLSISVGVPAGLAVGDVMVAFATVRIGNGAWLEDPEDDGFTVQDTQFGTYATSKVYTKVADAGDVAGSGWTLNYDNGHNQVYSLAVLAFTGVDATTPVVDAGGSFNDSSSAAAQITAAPSITTDAAGNVLLFYTWCKDYPRTHSGWATATQNPSSWTELFDAGDSCTHALAYGAATGAGATGNWSVLRSGVGRWNVEAIALADSGGAPAADPDTFLDGVWG